MNSPETAKCPACAEKRMHTVREFQTYHPLAGHGSIEGRSTIPEPAAVAVTADD